MSMQAGSAADFHSASIEQIITKHKPQNKLFFGPK
jgi:hypothetical protein